MSLSLLSRICRGLFMPWHLRVYTNTRRYFVTDFMATDLHQILTTQTLREPFIQYFIYQIFVCMGLRKELRYRKYWILKLTWQRGLKYIHSAGVVHGDLNPSNILVNDNCDLKICDFGLACVQGPQMASSSTTHYRAPEILLTQQRYNAEVDIWSVGCIFAEKLEGKVLFPGRDYMHQFSIITDLLGSPPGDLLQSICSENVIFASSLQDTDYASLLTLCLLVDNSICQLFTEAPAQNCDKGISEYRRRWFVIYCCPILLDLG